MKRIIIFGLFAVLFSSCMQESLEPVGQGSYEGNTPTEASLELSVAVDSLESKSVITSSTLPAGAQVGVHLVDGTSTGFYQGHDYSNVLYTMNSGKLTTDETVMLTPTSGTVYAYYPYVPDADITSLPVSALTQTDYMYATSHSGLTFSNYSASLVMNHAMAVASFRIVKGNYGGACKVSQVAVKGSNLYTSAKYNGKNGSILSRSSANSFITSSEGSFTMTTSGTARNIILIPASVSGSATVSINLDGYDRTVTVPSFYPQAGKRYTYTLTVNEEEIIVSNVTVDPWVENNSQYNVYITGNTKDIAINQQVNEDGSITITAIPLLPIEVLNNVTIRGSVTKSVKDITTLDRAKVITLSSIKSNVYLNFNGLTRNYVIHKYFFPSTYSGNVEFWGSNAQLPGTIKMITVNGEEGTRSMSSAGRLNKELEVKIWFDKLNTTILKNNYFGTYSNSKYLTYWEIPEGIIETEGSGYGQVNHSSKFSCDLYCHIKFPKSLKVISNHTFAHQPIPSVEFPKEASITFKHQCFKGCNISSLELPNTSVFNLESQFEGCPISGELIIPGGCVFTSSGSPAESVFRNTKISRLIVDNGVTSLGTRFKGFNFSDISDLVLIDLPNTLTSLGVYDFKDCSSLNTIICRAASAPDIMTAAGYQTFWGVSPSGRLIVPSGATGYDVWLKALNVKLNGVAGTWTIQYSDDL